MNSPFSNFRFIIFFVIFLLILALAQTGILIWLGISLKIASIDSLISNSLLTVACISVINGLRFYTPDKNRIQYFIAWCIGLTSLWLIISRWVLLIVMEEHHHTGFIEKSLPFRFVFGLFTIGLMAMFAILWNKQQQQLESEERQQDAEKLERNAELFNIRQQLQPHFLFNSLNSINALITTQPDMARQMVIQLSEFLRGTLRKDEKQLVKLEEELHLLQLYLDIEKVRFAHRLKTNLICSDECKQKLLPPLLLQPLVENAIKFGLYDTTGEVTISVLVAFQNNLLEITIQNPFDPETASANQGTGFGLTSVQRRLYLLFGRNDLMNTKAENNFFTITLLIPQG